VAITGAVYDLANAAVAPTLTFGNVRTGAVGTVGVTNAAITLAQYQDSLDVTATSANVRLALTNPATIAADAAGDVTVRAATAGSLDATLSVGLVSNARGLAGLDDVTLGAQSVTVTGAAYDLARATLASTTLALGNVRTGTQTGVAVTNTVTTSADFQDSLDVVAATANGNLLLTNPANILAGQTRSVGVKANLAGSLDATVALGLTSNTNNVAGLTNDALAGQSIAVTGAAYDYAVAAVAPTLAFGNVRVAAGTTARTLAVTNTLVAADAAFQDSLTVTATERRSQLQNRGAALERMRATLQKLSFVPEKRIATRPSRGSKRRRLEGKRITSEKKQNRGGRGGDW
jgi:hypothetical protein